MNEEEMAEVFAKAQEGVDEWLEGVPTKWDDDSGLYVHAEVIQAVIEEILYMHQMCYKEGSLEPDSDFVAGQLGVLNLLSMSLCTFTKRHSEDIARCSAASVDFDAALSAMTAIERLRDMFDKGRDD